MLDLGKISGIDAGLLPQPVPEEELAWIVPDCFSIIYQVHEGKV